MKFMVMVLSLYCMCGTIAYAQWEPDVRLTFDGATSNTGSSNTWSIAAQHDSVYAVWTDTRDGNSEIYFKRSLNQGSTWESDVRLTNDAAISGLPSILVRNRSIHVAWFDTRAGMNNFEIYYKRSTDAGETWSTDMRLTNDPAFSWYQSIALTNSNLHVVWRESRDGNYDIFYKRSTDEGLSWGNDTNLTQAAGSSETPCIAALGARLHVLWFDNRDGGAYEIYYKRSTNEGVSWGPDIRLTNDAGVSFGPCAVAKDSMIHVIWQDSRDGNWELYYKRSCDYGFTWGPDTRLTIASETSESPSVAVSASNVHVVWWDNRDSNYEIYYKVSTDQGTTWQSDARLTSDGSWSQFPHITAIDSVLHVIWKDGRAGNDEIYYKRNPSGNPAVNEIPGYAPGIAFSVRPTLFTDGLSIEFSRPLAAPFWITLQDILGRSIIRYESGPVSPGVQLCGNRIATLPAGVYILTIESRGKTIGYCKIVKVK